MNLYLFEPKIALHLLLFSKHAIHVLNSHVKVAHIQKEFSEK